MDIWHSLFYTGPADIMAEIIMASVFDMDSSETDKYVMYINVKNSFLSHFSFWLMF